MRYNLLLARPAGSRNPGKNRKEEVEKEVRT